ncbi:hypothetical protein PENSPDRAFT_242590 [Peniophora sp. CONT]|nr:hypothetical protein PENSPDRAFT_242590 [Peniophora sp. CONT]
MISSGNPVLLLFVAGLVLGQDFSIPPDWRKPNSSRLRPERLSIAQAAIGSLVSAINTTDGTTNPTMDVWTYANIPAAIAQHDYISGTQTNHELVSNIIKGFRNTHDPAYFNSSLPLQEVTAESLAWGLAAIYGYRAYNDGDMLNAAIDVLNVASVYTVSSTDGANGTQHTRSVSFPVSCAANGGNVSSAGAVFWKAVDPTDLGCNGETVGAYVALAMHLWELTGQTRYLDVAHPSANFIYTHMYSQSSHIVTDTYNIGGCSGNSLAWTYNQGFFLEGLSILSLSPVSDASTWSNLLQTLVVSTVKTAPWITSNSQYAGVLAESDSNDPTVFSEAWVFRVAFTRGLYEVWSRANSSSPMANLIQAFMMVQYNALLDLASQNEDLYSPIWTGPSLQTRVPWGQLSALDVLNAAINMSSASTSTSSSIGTTTSPTATSTPSTTTSAPTPKTLSEGVIAGIAIGVAAVFVALVAGCVVWLMRRRRRGEPEGAIAPTSRDDDVAPFPPGLPVIQQHEDMLSPAYAGKNRSGYGYGSSSSGATASTAQVSTSAEEESRLAELSRLIQQVRAELHSPPPSYRAEPE